MWGSGDLTALLMLAALFVQWVAHSQREARREDRRLDRLEARAKRDIPTPVGPTGHPAGDTLRSGAYGGGHPQTGWR